jgi:hypothetical protein
MTTDEYLKLGGSVSVNFFYDEEHGVFIAECSTNGGLPLYLNFSKHSSTTVMAEAFKSFLGSWQTLGDASKTKKVIDILDTGEDVTIIPGFFYKKSLDIEASEDVVIDFEPEGGDDEE